MAVFNAVRRKAKGRHRFSISGSRRTLPESKPAPFGRSPHIVAEAYRLHLCHRMGFRRHLIDQRETRQVFREVARFTLRAQLCRAVKRRLPVRDSDGTGADLRQVVVAHRVLAGVGRVVELVPYKRVDGCIRRPRRGGEHAHSQRREGEREGEKDHLQPVCHAFCHFHSSLIWAFAAVYARRNRQAGAGTPPPALSARGRNRCGSSAQKI